MIQVGVDLVLQVDTTLSELGDEVLIKVISVILHLKKLFQELLLSICYQSSKLILLIALLIILLIVHLVLS